MSLLEHVNMFILSIIFFFIILRIILYSHVSIYFQYIAHMNWQLSELLWSKFVFVIVGILVLVLFLQILIVFSRTTGSISSKNDKKLNLKQFSSKQGPSLTFVHRKAKTQEVICTPSLFDWLNILKRNEIPSPNTHYILDAYGVGGVVVMRWTGYGTLRSPNYISVFAHCPPYVQLKLPPHTVYEGK